MASTGIRPVLYLPFRGQEGAALDAESPMLDALLDELAAAGVPGFEAAD